MSLDTLQQRIHRARTETALDSLYTEAGDYYHSGMIEYNTAWQYWRELNKRHWNAYNEVIEHYDFFLSDPPSDWAKFDSTLVTFDSTLYTFDQN